MQIVKQRYWSPVDRMIVGALLFLALLFLGVQIANADESDSSAPRRVATVAPSTAQVPLPGPAFVAN